jgi:tetratricopeptide (TPR) repeat protein
MRKNIVVAAAAAAISLFLCGFDFFGLIKANPDGETAERLFNTANEAMIKGNSTQAIELYYRLIEKHPEFRSYRADALYRLGTLLFKAERFEEAEKILQMLANKYKNYPQIRTAYEKLLYIYVQELRDNKRAKKVREIYEKKFGKSRVLENADKTENILNTSGAGGFEILKMTPSEISVTGVEESGSYDEEFFPVKCVISNSASSPDRKFILERKKKNSKYFLYISGGGKKAVRINGTKNGFGPQWSWDNRYVVFTAMDWDLKERQLKILDVGKNVVRNLFAASAVEPLTCLSPDGSLAAFWYLDGLWLANKSGISVSLISKKVNGKDVFMMAWSREGGKILVGKKIKGQERYYICTLGRKEFIIVK